MGGSAERIEQRFAELTRNELAELEADLEICDGVPHVEINRAAAERQAHVVLISTRGELGSVAQNVIRAAPCSVLTVRQEEGPAGPA
jgi:nucleotide-binding universal stress UspA family protein